MVLQLDPCGTESKPLSFAPEFLTCHRLSGRSARPTSKTRSANTRTVGLFEDSSAHSRVLEGDRRCHLQTRGILVANTRVTYQKANNTRLILGEAETLGEVNPD